MFNSRLSEYLNIHCVTTSSEIIMGCDVNRRIKWIRKGHGQLSGRMSGSLQMSIESLRSLLDTAKIN